MSLPSLDDVLAALAQVAPPRLAEDWDRTGLMIGRSSSPIGKITAALDPSLEAVRAAANPSGTGCLITHHPLFFKPLSALNTDTPIGRITAEAIRLDVAVVAAHTNLDSARGGVNDVLAAYLGVVNVVPLMPDAEDPLAGMGRLGVLKTPLTPRELAARVRDALGAEAVRLTGGNNTRLSRAALCSGSGGSLIGLAADLGAEVFIIGEAGYHDLLEARDRGLTVIEAGHRNTEEPVVLELSRNLNAALETAGIGIRVDVFAGPGEPYELV